MLQSKLARLAAAAALVLLAVGLGPQAIGGRSAPTPKRATTESLGGAERYRTHLSTDKPLYREGESVFVRGVILDARTHAPIPSGAAQATVQIKGPKGDVVASGNAQAVDSVLAFQWGVPPGTAGGEYTVAITYPWDGFPPAERKFEVRAYRAPRLKSQIVFVRDGYGPGDSVEVDLHSERAEGGIPVGAQVSVSARVDGAQVHASRTRLDERGNCRAKFELPKSIARGDGTVAFAIEDGGVVETATKTIPILLQTLDLAFYPEGGDLVVGLPSRVYVEAHQPNGKPADLEGAILDESGREVASVATLHEGRGRFSITPEAGRSYSLAIRKPSGISRTFPLPAAKAAGAILTVQDNVIANGAPAKVVVGVSDAGTYLLTLAQGETDVATKELRVKKGRASQRRLVAGGTHEETLELPGEVSGTLIATLWDSAGNPLAERLLFRAPKSALYVDVRADKVRYVPGDEVELTITARDSKQKPTSAVVGLTVTDESVLEMIEKREQAPRLPVMVLLEDEVRELADAAIYLDASNPKAPEALDLLLGTQGWRRFAYVDTSKFLSEFKDPAKRVLAFTIPRPKPRSRSRSRRPMAEDMIPMAAPEMPGEMMAEPPSMAAVPRAANKSAVRGMAAPRPVAQPAPGVPMASQVAPGMAGRRQIMRRAQPGLQWTRVYAHPKVAARAANERTDFTETVYWAAGLKVPESGELKVRFALSDAVTRFAVLADGFDAKGALVSETKHLESVEPFYVEPKLPLAVTTGDRIDLPVALVNGTADGLDKVRLDVTAPKGIAVAPVRAPSKLAPESRDRILAELNVKDFVGKADVTVAAAAGSFDDKVTRTMDVEPLGFPFEVASGGTLAPSGKQELVIDLPQTMVQGSITTEAAIMPSPLANMTQALERLIRQPSGCFEQTSSSNYPLVMAQQYFMSHSGVDPSLIERSRVELDKGYKRLTGFECKQHGYEWFGQDPGHEALTAYGLLEFTDMAKVFPVDTGMLSRTRAWLLQQRTGQGTFSHNRRALHTWLVDEDLHNGYIVWALLEAGSKDIGAEAKHFLQAARDSKNTYVTALGANVAEKLGDTKAASALMAKLAAAQSQAGDVQGATVSIVGSRGQSLQVETTALAALAWMQAPRFGANVERSMQWLTEVCKGGRYGSTQSTVLALRAIIAYDAAHPKPKATGKVELRVDGKRVGAPIAVSPEAREAIALPAFADSLRAGRHRIELVMQDGSPMPFTFSVRYHATVPDSSNDARLSIATRLASPTVKEGESTEAFVRVENTSDATLPTPIAIVGIPGGLEVRHDQLKELKKAERIATYEVRGRDVVLYWRELAPHAVVELPLSLVAAVPGRYTGAASRAYEYYADEFKRWAPGLRVEITPRSGD